MKETILKWELKYNYSQCMGIWESMHCFSVISFLPDVVQKTSWKYGSNIHKREMKN